MKGNLLWHHHLSGQKNEVQWYLSDEVLPLLETLELLLLFMTLFLRSFSRSSKPINKIKKSSTTTIITNILFWFIRWGFPSVTNVAKQKKYGLRGIHLLNYRWIQKPNQCHSWMKFEAFGQISTFALRI